MRPGGSPQRRIRPPVHLIRATDQYGRVIRATADLLTRLRLDHLFVGSVARAAHSGEPIESGSIDVVATMGPQQKNQLAMMAANNGFTVERDEVDAAEELDLVPMRFESTRVHILVASNALYGRMVADGVEAVFRGGGRPRPPTRGVEPRVPRGRADEDVRPHDQDVTLKVPRLEDFALLLQLNNDVESLMGLIESPAFDRASYNAKLTAIGLRGLVVPDRVIPSREDGEGSPESKP